MSDAVSDATSKKTLVTALDVAIVGGGFAGLYMLYRSRKLGFTARVFEAGSGVGGTWFWNRYPGARCDIESMEYSYQFDEALQQEWEWTERYATQPEILKYANHVADRFGLRDGIQLNTRVRSSVFDDASRRWTVTTEAGEVFAARFCVMATGCLSSTNMPKIPGVDRFGGAAYHTGRWPHDGVDFAGKRVAVIGTGSSAIQSIPHIAEQAKHLYVFQRTANYSIPAHNHRLDPRKVAQLKADYAGWRKRNYETPFGADFNSNEAAAVDVSADEREREFEARWAHGGLGFLGAFSDLVFSMEANDTAAEFIRNKVKKVVHDPDVAARLAPRHVVGCKRLCVDTGYYETFNRPNVTLVDVSAAPIEEITRTGLRTKNAAFEVDVIVYATGFDAMTGALSKIDIRGRGGLPLNEKWAEGPRTYLGVATAGFPNLFIVTGPGSPSVLSNMLPSIEQHVNWIAECIAHVAKRGIGTIEATAEAEDAWVQHVNEVGNTSLYPRCNSWYLGANVPGKPRVFMPYLGVPPYIQKCNEVAANGYAGFATA